VIIKHYIHNTYGYHVYRLGRFYFRVGRKANKPAIMPFRTSTAYGIAFWLFGLFIQFDWDLL
jgi:hypothetical protein